MGTGPVKKIEHIRLPDRTHSPAAPHYKGKVEDFKSVPEGSDQGGRFNWQTINQSFSSSRPGTSDSDLPNAFVESASYGLARPTDTDDWGVLTVTPTAGSASRDATVTLDLKDFPGLGQNYLTSDSSPNSNGNFSFVQLAIALRTDSTTLHYYGGNGYWLYWWHETGSVDGGAGRGEFDGDNFRTQWKLSVQAYLPDPDDPETIYSATWNYNQPSSGGDASRFYPVAPGFEATDTVSFSISGEGIDTVLTVQKNGETVFQISDTTLTDGFLVEEFPGDTVIDSAAHLDAVIRSLSSGVEAGYSLEGDSAYGAIQPAGFATFAPELSEQVWSAAMDHRIALKNFRLIGQDKAPTILIGHVVTVEAVNKEPIATTSVHVAVPKFVPAFTNPTYTIPQGTWTHIASTPNDFSSYGDRLWTLSAVTTVGDSLYAMMLARVDPDLSLITDPVFTNFDNARYVRYDFLTDIWTVLISPPDIISASWDNNYSEPIPDDNGYNPLSTVYKDGYIYTFHRADPDVRPSGIEIAGVWRYSIADNIWENILPYGEAIDPITNIYDQAICLYGDNIYLIGGWYFTDSDPDVLMTDRAYVYSIPDNAFTGAPSLPAAPQRQLIAGDLGVAAVADGLIWFLGMNGLSSSDGNTWRYREADVPYPGLPARTRNSFGISPSMYGNGNTLVFPSGNSGGLFSLASTPTFYDLDADAITIYGLPPTPLDAEFPSFGMYNGGLLYARIEGTGNHATQQLWRFDPS